MVFRRTNPPRQLSIGPRRAGSRWSEVVEAMAPGWMLLPRVSVEPNGWAAHSPTDVEFTPVVLNLEPWRPIRVTVHVPALQ